MNKTVVFITFTALAALGLVGGIVLLVHRPDATATFTNLLVLVLGLVVTAAGTFAALGKVNEKVDTLQKQTNGQLHSKEQKIAELQAELDQYHKNSEPPTGGDGTVG